MMWNMKPLFSVIVPVYGVERYIKKCIESILSQNFSDYELILVDDGSLDTCPEICDEYARTYDHIKVIHKVNGGLVSARKAGGKIASGRYILNVDGDDWVKDGYFKAIAKTVNKYEPDVICFGTDYCWERKVKSVPCRYGEKFYSREELEKEIFPVLFEAEDGEYFPPSIWSKAIKRDLYEKCQNNVDDRIAIGEDIACTRQAVFKAKNMYVMRECLYCYRQNDESMTKKKRAFSMLAPELISKLFFGLTDKYPQMWPQISRCVVHLFFCAALTQFHRKESYREIVASISGELDKQYIQTAIQNCCYSRKYLEGRVALFCLKYRMYFFMRLLTYVKK